MRPEDQALAFEKIAAIKQMLADKKDPKPKPAPAPLPEPF